MVYPKKRKTGRPSKRPNPELLATLYENHSATELAEMYGVTPGTVRSWMCRIRKEYDNEQK
ncbi:hypothetical protein [Frisingicoccus sp.]|uniref:hypothetical protein n=1 Tax=Frisingicoccus sp. TaxID=1918627 RepID=UPI003AB62B7D